MQRGLAAAVAGFAWFLGSVACATPVSAQAANPVVPVAPSAPTQAAAPTATPRSHLDLDWTSQRRWVHIDNVLSAKVGVFEGARLEWLAALRQGDSLLGDGRPLFWCARSDSVQTYFTFYPFRTMADLDARGAMRQATEDVVGKAAVERYNLGDEGLVSPHYTQIWQRSPDDDVAWPGTEALTERTAGAGRLDIHMLDLQRSDEADSLLSAIRATLVAHEYPLACRNYRTLYGNGQNVMFWLAPDSTVLRKAPSLESVLVQALGETKGRATWAAFRSVFPVQKSYEVVRRADLSNMGK